jgi:hypothetical protein
MSSTERAVVRLESQFTGLETMIRFQLDKIREEKDELKDHLTKLLSKLDTLAEADLQVSNYLAKSQAQWSLIRWISGAVVLMVVPFVALVTPLIIKNIVIDNAEYLAPHLDRVPQPSIPNTQVQTNASKPRP